MIMFIVTKRPHCSIIIVPLEWLVDIGAWIHFIFVRDEVGMLSSVSRIGKESLENSLKRLYVWLEQQCDANFKHIICVDR